MMSKSLDPTLIKQHLCTEQLAASSFKRRASLAHGSAGSNTPLPSWRYHRRRGAVQGCYDYEALSRALNWSENCVTSKRRVIMLSLNSPQLSNVVKHARLSNRWLTNSL